MSSRHGMAIPVIVTAAVLLLGGLAVSTGSGSGLMKGLDFTSSENLASDKSNCRSQASQYCVNRPDGNWSNVHKNCIEYADAVDDVGDKLTCPTGYEQVDTANDGEDECPSYDNEEHEPCGDTTDSDGDGTNDIDDECPDMPSEQHSPCGNGDSSSNDFSLPDSYCGTAGSVCLVR